MQQFVRNAGFRPIVLNPDFAVFDVEMQYASINTPLILPTGMNHLIMVALRVETQFNFDLLIRW